MANLTYGARYTESDTSNTIELRLSASTDQEAVAELRGFVEAGYRNKTHATVDLSDGRIYGATNKHGTAHGARRLSLSTLEI